MEFGQQLGPQWPNAFGLFGRQFGLQVLSSIWTVPAFSRAA